MARAGGYYRLADLCAAQPDLRIFRSFQAPNTLVLLHMEAEIVRLFEELQIQVCQDRTAQDTCRRDFECNFAALAYKLLGHESSVQYQKLLDLRLKLRDYSSSESGYPDVSRH